MKVEVITKRPSRGDLIVFSTAGSRPVPGVSPAEFDGAPLSLLLEREAGTKAAKGISPRRLHVGVGEKGKVTPQGLRRAAGTAVKALLKIGAEEIAIEAGDHAAHLSPIVEGALLAAYKFEGEKAPAARRKNALKQLTVVAGFGSSGSLKEAKKAAEAGQILAEAANLVRAIGNLPGNEITPITLAERARKIAQANGLKFQVWDERQLKKEGFGGILAVGKGSANPPRFITLQYQGAKSKGAAPYAIVGKAITFDSGGISIKPADRMDEMKWDKMGGCAVLGILQAVSALKLPINVIGLIASAENMPSANAYRPGDIVTTYDGQTIEVLNTDAEGRIVLADALSYAVKNHQPKAIFDLATLTGACVVALGGSRAGLFTDDETLRAQLWSRSEEVGDPVWPLPVGDEFDEQIKSDVALVKNTGGREGGASTAASFLRHWTGGLPWVHLDIAGPAWITKDLPYLEKGATGFGVRLVVDYLRRVAA